MTLATNLSGVVPPKSRWSSGFYHALEALFPMMGQVESHSRLGQALFNSGELSSHNSDEPRTPVSITSVPEIELDLPTPTYPCSQKRGRGRPRKTPYSSNCVLRNPAVQTLTIDPTSSGNAASGVPSFRPEGYPTRARKAWALGKLLGLQFEGPDSQAEFDSVEELNQIYPSASS